MSKLSNLLGKSKTYTVGGIEMELKPRTMKDLDLILSLSNESERSEALKKLIRVTLLDSVEGATEEEVDQVAFQHFKELSEAIVDVNGLKEMQDASTNRDSKVTE